jgi:hypothetical protein
MAWCAMARRYGYRRQRRLLSAPAKSRYARFAGFSRYAENDGELWGFDLAKHLFSQNMNAIEPLTPTEFNEFSVEGEECRTIAAGEGEIEQVV